MKKTKKTVTKERAKARSSITAKKLDSFFAKMPNVASIKVFNHGSGCGLVIRWAEKGTGFGEMIIYGDKNTNQWRVDTEAMSVKWCAGMLPRLIGTTVL